MEALLAAVFSTAASTPPATVFDRAWAEELAAPAPRALNNPKSALQEWAQGQGRPLPTYRVVGQTGSDHAPTFTVEVSIEGVEPLTAPGRSRQDAEKAAATGHAPTRRRDLTDTNPQQNRAGFAAIIGAPNAGKSTLVNRLTGSKVSIVTQKVQTTRFPVRGIAIEGDAQIVLVDTPGIFTPRRRLDRAMVASAWGGASDADVVVHLIDAASHIASEGKDGTARRPQVGRGHRDHHRQPEVHRDQGHPGAEQDRRHAPRHPAGPVAQPVRNRRLFRGLYDLGRCPATASTT